MIGTPETIADALALLGRGSRPGLPVPIGAIVLSRDQLSAARSLPVPILGSAAELPAIHRTHAFGTALVSIPAAFTAPIARVRSLLEEIGVTERFLPTIDDVVRTEPNALSPVLAAGELNLSKLVGREPRRIDEQAARRVLGARRVLITGAGGSIGSELARIAAALSPSQLQLMDRSDNALFDIDREIGSRFPEVPRKAVLHDVVDSDGTLRRLVSLRPEVIFHAAAHKHVPLMEDHPAAAVNNNFFGTKSIADAALATGALRFVMVSTDKAVNPTSVMGATKRLAEVYVRSLNSAGRTRFSLVRFGNVLGSACSVLPIWGRQLAEGGPITVTDPEMTRFFMTIPEAAALVLQAATIEHGDVFVLDMGSPVRILDLARRFIEAHGLRPCIEGEVSLGGATGRVGIAIRFTGKRPGEKLHEELSYQAEELQPTAVPGVLSWSGQVPDAGEVAAMIADLSSVRQSQDAEAVVRVIARHVPGLNRPSTSKPEQTPVFSAA